MILNPLGQYVLLFLIYPNQHMPLLPYIRPAYSLPLSIYPSPNTLPYNTYPSPLIVPSPINPLHTYTRSYKLISFKDYIPIYPILYKLVVGPPRGTVEVITHHVLSYN